MKIAVITGASSGIGWEFVKGIDQSEKLDEIWVIARRKERLEQVAATAQTKVRPIALDLTDPESFEVYRRMLEEERPRICALTSSKQRFSSALLSVTVQGLRFLSTMPFPSSVIISSEGTLLSE